MPWPDRPPTRRQFRLNISGLTPAQRYYFVVRTVTSAHANNANTVESEASDEVSAVAWTEIAVQITGTVTSGGSPLAGVVMSGLTGNPSTNASGAYTGTVAAGWSGTVFPMLAGYSFTPASRNYASISTDQTAQDYTATAVIPTIMVTSPNGGETWAVGSTHAVTWTQTDLTGSVTVDLYKGGVYQKTLGTAEGTAGTFPWLIAPGRDCRHGLYGPRLAGRRRFGRFGRELRLVPAVERRLQQGWPGRHPVAVLRDGRI